MGGWSGVGWGGVGWGGLGWGVVGLGGVGWGGWTPDLAPLSSPLAPLEFSIGGATTPRVFNWASRRPLFLLANTIGKRTCPNPLKNMLVDETLLFKELWHVRFTTLFARKALTAQAPA